MLFSGSITENISYGKEGASKEEIVAAAKMANAHDFVSAFPDGYDTQVGEKGIQLSGGQKQRIAIARAIIRDPKILILDEATSALDNTSERIVQEALDNLLKLKKRTTIVIAHRLTTIRNADKIVVLSDGKVVEEGNHDDLFAKNGQYATLVKLQMSSIESESVKSNLPLSPSQELLASIDIEQGKGENNLEMIIDKTIIVTEEDLEKNTSSVAWVWQQSAPERGYMYLGLIGALMIGASFPLLGYFISAMIKIFYK